MHTQSFTPDNALRSIGRAGKFMPKSWICLPSVDGSKRSKSGGGAASGMSLAPEVTSLLSPHHVYRSVNSISSGALP